jgi:membrane protein DedA with SNARE-associated domain
MHLLDGSTLSLILRHGVPLVALLVFAGELGFPTGIPVEIALLAVGAYAVHTLPALIAAVLLVSTADLLGTTLLHLLVRSGGVRLLGWLFHRHGKRPEATAARWRQRLGDRDALLVFVVRLLPLVRMYVSIGAGLLRIRLRGFVAGAAPAALLWAGTPLVLGYLFRADVHRFEARYTASAHLLLAALPAVGLVTGLALWIGNAHPTRATLLRTRSVLGLIAAFATAGYLVRLAWRNEWSVEHGAAALPHPLLALWLGALALLALLLLAFAAADFRAAAALHVRTPAVPRRLRADLMGMCAWLSVLSLAGGIPVMLELRYPAL